MKWGRRRDLDSGALVERAARFRMLLATAFDSILISQNGVIAEVSDSLLAISGYTPDELLGRRVLEFVAEESRAQVQRRVDEGAEGRFNALAVLKDGRRLEVELITRNYTIHGRVTRFTAVRDLTEKRWVEKQVRHALDTEAFGRLAASVAYDINYLLSMISSYTDTLLQEGPEPFRRDVEEIGKAADTAAALTRELLSYGPRPSAEPAPADLNLVVRSSERWLRCLIGEDDALATDLCANACQVHLDPDELRQLILNLAVAARDAVAGGGRLLIRTRNVDITEVHAEELAAPSPGPYVMLCTVSHGGTGLTDEMNAQGVEPGAASKEAGRESGLGIALVHRIVEQNRGFVIVDSPPGGSTCLAVHLPRVDDGRRPPARTP